MQQATKKSEKKEQDAVFIISSRPAILEDLVSDIGQILLDGEQDEDYLEIMLETTYMMVIEFKGKLANVIYSIDPPMGIVSFEGYTDSVGGFLKPLKSGTQDTREISEWFEDNESIIIEKLQI